MKIQGADLHATQGPLGAVILPDALERQMRIMKSMGVNALRTAHNPPAPELTAVCEQLGILMMVEAFDCWHTGKPNKMSPPTHMAPAVTPTRLAAGPAIRW